MEQKLDPIVQLMRMQWFPATALDPRTVVTLRTLRLFHALTIQGELYSQEKSKTLVTTTPRKFSVQYPFDFTVTII